MTTTKPNYKDTLNLPKTSFAMKANLNQNEPLAQKRWEAEGMYAQVQQAHEGAEAFVFHDGPPYTSGAIHTGHLLNKALKDIVVRSRGMMGKKVAFVPGWDCHGLPIEHKVMTELVESGKIAKLNALTEDQRRMAVRRECKAYAEKFLKLQMGGLKRLLTLADYDHPYMTMAPEYERGVLEAFADLLEEGLVYRALKPVHWSIANQTALAEAELEYEDREDPSIYVDFEAADREAVARAFGVELDVTPCFMIWTTTPWTLPANLAIAVHERYRYSLVEMDGGVSIVASDLVEKVTKAAKVEKVKVLGETEGAKLVGLRYRHPFVDVVERRESVEEMVARNLGRRVQSVDDLGTVFSIVAADYVTLEDGTGLVHTAPGHGAEDYRTGLKEGLPIYCPVKGDGTYDQSVPEWLRGVTVWDANEKVMKHLRESGHLFHSFMFTHSYPHDWRSKTPVIFRATEQWFIGVDLPTKRTGRSLREMALHAAENDVEFYPAWGRNRMRGMLESRPDWCLSRQRAWGLPIPAFFTGNSAGDGDDQYLMTPASVRAVAKLVGEKGSDIWFQADSQELLTHYDAGSDPNLSPAMKRYLEGGTARLRKSMDIFDVWFESGTSWNAVMRARGIGYPMDLYLEGSDQHRGWFQSSLLPGLGVTGVSPFKALLTHGFIVDKDGKKMSKSLGNTIEVDDLLKEFGADVARWWVSSLAFENDIKMDLEFLKAAGETYRKVRNTLRFLLSNLDDFPGPLGRDGQATGSTGATGPAATSIDAWALAEASAVERDVIRAYETYEFREGHQRVYNFCNETLSAVYCAAVKDRLYCDTKDSPRRRQTQAAMWKIADMLCRLLSPILPYTGDEAYRALVKDEKATVQTAMFARLDATADPDWAKVMDVRDEALKAMEGAKERGIENPLDAEVVLPDPDGMLNRFSADLADLLGVSRVKLDRGAAAVVVHDLRNEPRCERSWKRDGTVRARSDGGMLSDRDAAAVGVA